MKYNYLRPKKRSKFRIAMGRRYFTLKRKVDWIKNDRDYGVVQESNHLDYLITDHKTPLYRGLKAVDRWMDDNKVININLALEKVNTITIGPGQTLSYWKTIGKPTKRRGYVSGMVLDHGKFKSGTGGGLCQLSNLIFWMTLHTPLDIVERHRHSYDVFPDVKRTQPFGSGATCVYNYRDLQIQNNTEETYQLVFHMDDHHLHGRILSSRAKYFDYEIYEGSHKISLEHWGGYLRHNTIKRRVFSDSKQIDDQFVCENHGIMMYAPLLETDHS